MQRAGSPERGTGERHADEYECNPERDDRWEPDRERDADAECQREPECERECDRDRVSVCQCDAFRWRDRFTASVGRRRPLVRGPGATGGT